MAGLPEQLIDKALEVLATLEGTSTGRPITRLTPPNDQLTLFQTKANDALSLKLSDINPDEMTPKQALEILYEIKSMIKDEK